jgi:hypothetical protein
MEPEAIGPKTNAGNRKPNMHVLNYKWELNSEN